MSVVRVYREPPDKYMQSFNNSSLDWISKGNPI